MAWKNRHVLRLISEPQVDQCETFGHDSEKSEQKDKHNPFEKLVSLPMRKYNQKATRIMGTWQKPQVDLDSLPPTLRQQKTIRLSLSRSLTRATLLATPPSR